MIIIKTSKILNEIAKEGEREHLKSTLCSQMMIKITIEQVSFYFGYHLG